MTRPIGLLLLLAACKLPDLELPDRFRDLDDDGYTEAEGDCLPRDATSHPGAEDVCDGADNDCDGDEDNQLDVTGADPFWGDADEDGYGDATVFHTACYQHVGYAPNPDDCDDDDPAVHPERDDPCNGVDDDCDFVSDEDAPGVRYADDDGDGYGDPYQAWCQGGEPPTPHVANPNDCHDGNASIHPLADELCNGEDDDCDGSADENAVDGVLECRDGDADGLGDPGSVTTRCPDPDDQWVADCTDCDDLLASVGGPVTWYADADEDDYGDPEDTTEACGTPAGPPPWVTVADDCDPADTDVNPGEEEICNTGIDEDCDPLTDCRFPGTWRLTGTGGGPDARFDGRLATFKVGEALASGDIDGDDLAETFVTQDPGLGPRQVLLVRGSQPQVSGVFVLDEIDGAVFEDLGEGSDEFGTAVTPFWELDGDAFDEILIGDPGANDVPVVGGATGSAYLFYSNTGMVQAGGGSNPLPAWAVELRIDGGASGDRFGSRIVATPGARSDEHAFAVSAPGVGDDDGAVYLVKLGEFVHVGGATAVADAETSEMIEKWAGPAGEGTEFGTGLAFYRNESGIGSLAIGARNSPDLDDAGDVQDGALYIYRLPTNDVSVLPAPITIYGATGMRGGFGTVVINAGDVNGDAVDDLAVSAPTYNFGDVDHRGKVYLLSGRIPDGLVTRIENIPAEYFLGAFVGPQTDAQFGMALASCDVDRDAYDDVIIGAPDLDAGAQRSGGAWLIYGRAQSWGIEYFGTEELPGVTRFFSTNTNDGLGTAVACGDVEGNGRDDVVIGAPGFDPTTLRGNAGAAFLMYGIGQ